MSSEEVRKDAFDEPNFRRRNCGESSATSARSSGSFLRKQRSTNRFSRGSFSFVDLVSYHACGRNLPAIDLSSHGADRYPVCALESRGGTLPDENQGSISSPLTAFCDCSILKTLFPAPMVRPEGIEFRRFCLRRLFLLLFSLFLSCLDPCLKIRLYRCRTMLTSVALRRDFTKPSRLSPFVAFLFVFCL